MRASIVALVLAATVVATASAGATFGTSLRITYWADSATPLARVSWTLRCEPTGGSLSRPARACQRLLAGGAKLFAPLPKNVVCTEMYGGPQKARIVGTLRGLRIWATFARTNGCEIDRWQRISPWLVPPGGVTS